MEEEKEKEKVRNRDKITKENHKITIANLYLKGNTQQYIAKQLGIGRTQVGRDLQEIYSEWQKKYVGDISQLKAVQLEKLDSLELEYWNLYEESKKDSFKKITKAKIDAFGIPSEPKIIEGSEMTIKNIGDCKILDSIANLISQRCRLLGLEKINLNVNHSGSFTIEDKVKLMSDDELIKIIQIPSE